MGVLILATHSIPPYQVNLAVYPTAWDTWIAGALFLASAATAAMPDVKHGTMLLLVFFAIRATAGWQSRSWPVRMLARLGDASYGIYLIHIGLCFLLVLVAQRIGIGTGYWTTVLLLIVAGGPPSFAFGMLDDALQRRLKRLLPVRPAFRAAPEPQETRG